MTRLRSEIELRKKRRQAASADLPAEAGPRAKCGYFEQADELGKERRPQCHFHGGVRLGQHIRAK